MGVSELRKLPLKEILVAANIDGRCVYYNTAFVDGGENTQMWCTQIRDREHFDECERNDISLDDRRANRIGDYLDDYILTTPASC